ncbi:tagaturonate reductase [Flavobacterium azooxidireducens]|uniref:Tagaturonate reductase n=1 Tax=Flavobacterium azooxidireducens TaxID=1871076 RepID=A0ABY4KDE2_9FLAO|nr:tagaturonate reductase [Flavobacterium azooxidireducens]UPQ78828.1 tagaturonate reductase [Flavobacterium azooxidireducens]
MENLVKQKLSRESIGFSTKYPIKVVQFGEGNFLRAFVDYAFQILNKKADFNGGIAVIQPLDNGMVHLLNEQDGLYTLFMNGVKKGEKIHDIELITNVVQGINTYKNFQEYLDLAKVETLEFVISNTTEAGIEYVDSDKKEMQPPNSFPGKLSVFLYERFKHFNGDVSKGLTIIPCELINYNADTLKEILLKLADLWQLGEEYKYWITTGCTFHNTLVDRIVPGYPRNEIEDYNNKLDYHDDILVTAEPFFLWVIEGDEKLKEKLPFHKTNLDVKIVSDMQPYRTRKVRILNGAHTAMVPFSILYGNETVKETLDNKFTEDFVTKAIFNEINPTLPMEKSELDLFADEVLDRFRNPFIKHQLADIALNSVSKFKVRVLPSLLEYVKINQKLPVHLTFSFACLIRFYKKEWQDRILPINDTKEIISFFENNWKSNDLEILVKQTLSNLEFWENDLNEVIGLTEALVFALTEIENKGIENGFISFKNQYDS